MNRIAHWSAADRASMIVEAARRTGYTTSVVEKDFWVVWVLGRLFSSDMLAPKILFKGGTSLSKVFGCIDRFSEDIDLILDWNEVVAEDPMAERSKTKQDAYNKAVPVLSQEYIANTFLPEVKNVLDGVCRIAIEEGAPDVINIQYPSSFENEYLRPEIRLEIGPLAQWIPNSRYEISSYAAEAFPELFESPSCFVHAIKAERTFWEKATILHHEAHRPEGTLVPARYSRHYYDLYLMALTDIREISLGDLDLLERVVEFKMRFYPRGWAQYDLAKPGTLKLVPPDRILKEMRKDYDAMQEMIFGRRPTFDKIIEGLKQLETDINALEAGQ